MRIELDNQKAQTDFTYQKLLCNPSENRKTVSVRIAAQLLSGFTEIGQNIRSRPVAALLLADTQSVPGSPRSKSLHAHRGNSKDAVFSHVSQNTLDSRTAQLI